MNIETLPLQIGKYKISGLLGKGSMGVVYKARDPQIGRTVAIKVLRNQVREGATLDSHTALERFHIEAKAAGNLRHKNIVTIFEVNFNEDSPYIVMDYIEGKRLDEFISEDEPVGAEEILYYLSQIVSALDYAHKNRVIHCDIKPSNIIIDKNENVYILDFGVANIAGATIEDNNKTVFGTPGYMSPEQILNEKLDGRSDLFSLAIVAFECFTGVRAFFGTDFTSCISAILEGRRRSLQDINPSLPLSLESTFEKAFSKKKESRFNTGVEFLKSISEAIQVDIPAISPKKIINNDDLNSESKELGFFSQAIRDLKGKNLTLVLGSFFLTVGFSILYLYFRTNNADKNSIGNNYLNSEQKVNYLINNPTLIVKSEFNNTKKYIQLISSNSNWKNLSKFSDQELSDVIKTSQNNPIQIILILREIKVRYHTKNLPNEIKSFLGIYTVK